MGPSCSLWSGSTQKEISNAPVKSYVSAKQQSITRVPWKRIQGEMCRRSKIEIYIYIYWAGREPSPKVRKDTALIFCCHAKIFAVFSFTSICVGPWVECETRNTIDNSRSLPGACASRSQRARSQNSPNQVFAHPPTQIKRQQAQMFFTLSDWRKIMKAEANIFALLLGLGRHRGRTPTPELAPYSPNSMYDGPCSFTNRRLGSLNNAHSCDCLLLRSWKQIYAFWPFPQRIPSRNLFLNRCFFAVKILGLHLLRVGPWWK